MFLFLTRCEPVCILTLVCISPHRLRFKIYVKVEFFLYCAFSLNILTLSECFIQRRKENWTVFSPRDPIKKFPKGRPARVFKLMLLLLIVISIITLKHSCLLFVNMTLIWLYRECLRYLILIRKERMLSIYWLKLIEFGMCAEIE